MTKRVTIKDLAERLQTTPSTVSRALRDKKGVGEPLRKKVKELAVKLGYQPNAVAAGLRKGRSNTIGVIVPRINRDFFSGVISGIEEVAFENHYNVIICQTHDKIDKERQYVETLLSARVDGILASLSIETNTCDHFRKVQYAGIPLIFFDRIPQDMQVNQVVIDDYDGAYRIVQHMIRQGYRRIVHFAGPEYLNIYRDRLNGYKDALKEHGITVDPDLIILNKLTLEEGQKSMGMLLRKKIRPDAVFSASDYAALGALLVLLEKGFRIPEQIGVAGFSNEKFTSYITPSLTTVDQHSREIGRHCTGMFLEEIRRNVPTPRKIVLSPELLIRESTSKKTT